MDSLSTQRDVKAVFSDVRRSFLAVLVVASIAGCATVQPRSAEEIVKQRSQARWDALVKGDVKAAYTFFSPGSRAVLSEADYVASIRRGFWKSANVDRVVCESAETCQAQITIEYEFQGTRIKTPLRETWIREGSDWWYVQK